MLIIFGGQLAKDGSTSNDLFWMTLDRMEWHLHPAKGDKPQSRCAHSPFSRAPCLCVRV